MFRSTCSPWPFDYWLSSCTWVWSYIFSLVHKFIVGVIVIVQDIQMSWIKEVAILRVTEIDNSALLYFSISICHIYTLVAKSSSFHSTDPIDSYEAIWKRLGLVVPFLTSVDIVTEICSKSICNFRWGFWMAGNSGIANMGLRHLEILSFNIKGMDNQNRKSNQYRFFYEHIF